MRLDDLSFNQRLVVAVLFLTCTTTVTLGYVASRLSEDFLRNQFKERMDFLAKYLALNAEIAFLLEDTEALSKLGQNLLSEKDVVSVSFIDSKSDVIFAIGQKDMNPSNAAAKSAATVKLGSSEDSLPFLSAEKKNKALGTVEIVYSSMGIENYLGKLRVLYAVATIALSFIGLLCFWFFARSLSSPLKALAKAVDKVAEGDLSSRVDGGNLPETRQLADGFNQMVVALAESRQHLEDTYQDLLQQKAMAEIGSFAFTVAHEIKNPLGIIKGSLDILKKPEVNDELKGTMLMYVEEEVVRLNRLIQDFLNYARPRQPVFSQFDICALLEDVVVKSRIEWSGKGIGIGLCMPNAPCYLKGDRDILMQVFINLIKNACESCESAGHGDVNIILEQTEQTWRISVADTGEGISEEAQLKAFTPFFTTKAKGSGLGLAFVEQAIKNHRGALSFEANEPKGAVFFVEIPME